MIGLVMRGALGGDGLGPCAMILGPIVALCALCGIWKFCCKFKVRDCRCMKRCLRMSGTDQFDDFDMMILVHSVKFTTSAKTASLVRVKAGDMVVETDVDVGGVFHQTMNLLVEQGSPFVEFELCDPKHRVMATLRMDIMKDILVEQDGHITLNECRDKVFAMKQIQKHVLNPKITLTFSRESIGDEEKALLGGINASAETEWMLTQHIQKMTEESKHAEEASGSSGDNKPELSEVELLAKGCEGPVERYGRMGVIRKMYMSVIGPPRKKRFGLHFWQTEKDLRDEKNCDQEIDLLKITSVSADPKRPEVFVVNFIDEKKVRSSIKINRVDRSRDVWVEILQLLVMKVHAERNDKKRGKR